MKKNLLKSTFVVSIMTMTSRVSGFIRDLVIAYVFGASGAVDSFFVAFRIPNFLRSLFGEGAFSQAFIPVLAEYREKSSEEEVRIFLNRICGALITVLFSVSVIAILVTPWLMWILAPGFLHDPGRFNLTVSMLRITFPYILFISLTAYISGILNTYGKFSIPAFTPNLLNLALIGAAIFLAPHFQDPIKALAWGVFIGGILQVSFQIPFLHKLNLLPKPQLLWSDPGVRRVLRLMLPAIFGVCVAQIGVMIDTIFASFLRAGSISWLSYSSRLTLFPLGVFGVAVATVVLPHLSRKHAIKSHEEFSLALDWGLRFVLVIAMPAMIAMLILSGPILATLFEHGEFDAFAVAMTQRSLIAFSLGIPAFMLVKVLASGFYSRQDIKTPVKIAIFAVISNIVLNAILIFPLKHAGLALATAITSSLNASLLFLTIYHKKFYIPGKGWGKFWIQLLFASFMMALLLIVFTAKLAVWIEWSTFSRVWHLTVLCSVGLIVYLGCLLISGMRPRDFVFNS